METKYYGYVFRSFPGVAPWALSQIPVEEVSVFSSSPNNGVTTPVNSQVPITNVILDHCDCTLTVGGGIMLRKKGVYEIQFQGNFSTSSASSLSLSVGPIVTHSSTVSDSSGSVALGEAIGVGIQKVYSSEDPVTLTFVNRSPTAITSTEPLVVIIRKIA